jgi:hypothetical protein
VLQTDWQIFNREIAAKIFCSVVVTPKVAARSLELETSTGKEFFGFLVFILDNTHIQLWVSHLM